MANVDFIKVAH